MRVWLRESYVNLTAYIEDPDSLTLDQVYARGTVIVLSSNNIVDILSWPHYAEIEDNGLEGESDLDKVVKLFTGSDAAH